ncbi:hypothetical protein FOZ62_010037 [Perkinsus olseni]|uniref:AAA+ ATPase domain-containing protein n=1 Tax=Perkinsus olseni TaxID=32597 RepID=A0A7J6QH10_PEROL|nr:hypothetical protein FOZ62_010037 [Perkinsus olseni]
MWASSARTLSSRLSSLSATTSRRRGVHSLIPRRSKTSSSSSPSKSLSLASAAGAILALATSSPALCEEPPDKKAKLGVEDAERYISSVVPHRPHSAGSSYDVLQRGDADVLKWQYYSDNGADLFYALVDVLMSITAGDEDVRVTKMDGYCTPSPRKLANIQVVFGQPEKPQATLDVYSNYQEDSGRMMTTWELSRPTGQLSRNDADVLLRGLTEHALYRQGSRRYSGTIDQDSDIGRAVAIDINSLACRAPSYGLWRSALGPDFAVIVGGTPSDDVWEGLVGYPQTKARVEETVLLQLKHPGLFKKIAEGTRGKAAPANRPKVVLFEGPPGTGKTSAARCIAAGCGIPLVYVPLEALLSKWYGESEKHLSKVFELARDLVQDGCEEGSGVIVFVDEVDALASSRDDPSGMHEASKRVLSVLLRELDGFSTPGKANAMLIAATNRKQDLDQAFVSRIDTSVEFALPDEASRAAIFGLYARQLPQKDCEQLAKMSAGLSGRNIKDACQDAERRWAAARFRELSKDKKPLDDSTVGLPDRQTYEACVREKKQQQRSTSRRTTAERSQIPLLYTAN